MPSDLAVEQHGLPIQSYATVIMPSDHAVWLQRLHAAARAKIAVTGS